MSESMGHVEGETLFEVSFCLDMRDVIDFNVQALERASSKQIELERSRHYAQISFIVLIAPALLALFTLYKDWHNIEAKVFLLSSIGLQSFNAGYILWNGWASRRKFLREGNRERVEKIAKTGGLSGNFLPQTLRLTTNGPVLIHHYGVSERHWRGISGIERTGRIFLLRTHETLAILVPIRAFGSSTDADRFFEICEREIGDHDGATNHSLVKYLQEHDIVCPKCDYNLRGLTDTNCPECGLKLNLGMLTM